MRPRTMVLAIFLGLFAVCALFLMADSSEAAVSVTPSAITPANASTDIALEPTLSLTLTINNAPHATIQWYTNETGSWVLHSTMTNIHNGTHTINATWLDEFHTTYYWKCVFTYTGGSAIVIYHFESSDHMISQETKDELVDITVWAMVLAVIMSVLGMIISKFRR